MRLRKQLRVLQTVAIVLSVLLVTLVAAAAYLWFRPEVLASRLGAGDALASAAADQYSDPYQFDHDAVYSAIAEASEEASRASDLALEAKRTADEASARADDAYFR